MCMLCLLRLESNLKFREQIDLERTEVKTEKEDFKSAKGTCRCENGIRQGKNVECRWKCICFSQEMSCASCSWPKQIRDTEPDKALHRQSTFESLIRRAGLLFSRYGQYASHSSTRSGKTMFPCRHYAPSATADPRLHLQLMPKLRIQGSPMESSGHIVRRRNRKGVSV